jgi:hypothetical protein
MRISTQRTLLRAATALAVLCAAAVVFLPATAAEFSTAPRLAPAAICDATIAFDCSETAISLFLAR